QLNGVRAGVAAVAGNAAAPADVKSAATQLSAKADALRKEIVATTEGGAITGEERLREHVDEIYGAINSVEDRPTNYQIARIDALDRELKDVETQWATFVAGDLAAFNAKLKAANLPPLTVAQVTFDPDDQPRGGRASALVRGLVGTRFYGNATAIEEKAEKD
ncbi:MAG TPA: sialidase, partial [Sphingomicrobium sp.]